MRENTTTEKANLCFYKIQAMLLDPRENDKVDIKYHYYICNSFDASQCHNMKLLPHFRHEITMQVPLIETRLLGLYVCVGPFPILFRTFITCSLSYLYHLYQVLAHRISMKRDFFIFVFLLSPFPHYCYMPALMNQLSQRKMFFAKKSTYLNFQIT